MRACISCVVALVIAFGVGSEPKAAESAQAAKTRSVAPSNASADQNVLVVSEPNWSSNNQQIKKIFDGYLLNPSSVKSKFYSYKSDGALGVPSLKINFPIEYLTLPGSASNGPQGVGIDINTKYGKRYIVPNSIAPAASACLFLDLELGQKLGAWGPECKIAQILQIPSQGDFVKKLAAGTDSSTYYYTPRKPNMQDVVRFILENGAGKKVEVTGILNIGSDDSYYGLLLQEAGQPDR